MAAFPPVTPPRILRDSAIALASALIVAGGFWAASPAESQAARPARVAGKPNLNGIWQAPQHRHYDILSHSARAALAMRPGPVVAGAGRRGARVGAVAPYPRAMALSRAMKSRTCPRPRRSERQPGNWLDRDPEIKCYLPGVPRANYMRAVPDPAQREGVSLRTIMRAPCETSC